MNDVKLTIPELLNLMSHFFYHDLNFETSTQTSKKSDTPNNKKINTDLEFPPEHYIKIIGNLLQADEATTILFLKKLYQLAPGSFYSLVLRIIAKEFDKKYENHIYDTDTIWMYSSLDSKIYPQATSPIKKVAFKYFAAFRSKEEAIKGVRLVSALKYYIFKWQKTEK